MKTTARIIVLIFMLADTLPAGARKRHNKDGNLQSDNWIRQISRVVTIKDSVASNNRYRIETKDKCFAEILIEKVKNGYVQAYAPTDAHFITPFSLQELAVYFKPYFDTIEVEDIDGAILKKTHKHQLLYTNITQFRVLEEWSYNRKTGQTNIRVMGVAPMLEVWSEWHDIPIGRKEMFWLRYDDVMDDINKYEQYHPVQNFGIAVWDDYMKH